MFLEIFKITKLHILYMAAGRKTDFTYCTSTPNPLKTLRVFINAFVIGNISLQPTVEKL